MITDINMYLLYNDNNISAFRLRKRYNIDYVKNPFEKSEVNTFIYDIKTNNIVSITVIDSIGDGINGRVDLIQGDQLTYDSKNKRYIYLADIKKIDDRISKFKVVIDSKFKCISATNGCENIGIGPAEFVGANK